MESSNGKIILSYDAQIEHLKSRGITFKYEFNEEKAKEYLQSHNSFFRLRAYRFDFRDLGTDTYRGLDFSYLVDLARIDDKLRKLILYMSIDIEHFSKMHLLKFITDNYAGSNACDIVGEYVSSLDSFRQKELNKVIIRNLNSVYTDDVCEKYVYQLDSKISYLPVQEFFEVIPFGKFTNFYQFCTERFFNLSSEEKKAQTEIYYLLLRVKDARNGAAHDNCFVNNLKAENAKSRPDYNMLRLLSEVKMSKRQRRRKFKNEKIIQIFTCLYAYHELIIKNPKNCYEFLDRPYIAVPDYLKSGLQLFVPQLEKFIEKIPSALEAKYLPAKETLELIRNTVVSWYLS